MCHFFHQSHTHAHRQNTFVDIDYLDSAPRGRRTLPHHENAVRISRTRIFELENAVLLVLRPAGWLAGAV